MNETDLYEIRGPIFYPYYNTNTINDQIKFTIDSLVMSKIKLKSNNLIYINYKIFRSDMAKISYLIFQNIYEVYSIYKYVKSYRSALCGLTYKLFLEKNI